MNSIIAKAAEEYYRTTKDTYPKIPIIESAPTEPTVKIGNKDYIMLCSNNYLGLASASFVKNAAIDAINKYGFGSAGSRWISGTTNVHIKLEKELASFKKRDSALTFSAGFMANSGVITALTGSVGGDITFPADESAIFSDEYNHASIIDGCRNSKAKVYIYGHKNLKQLEKLLSNCKETYKLIITDSVFSMDGDIAPLDKITEMAKSYEAMIMVDEAHAIGILGKHGRGAAEYFNVEDDISLSMGTLSKTFGSLGGYIAGDINLIEYLRCSSRTYIFSASMPVCNAASVLAILKEISKNYEHKDKVLHLSNYLRKNLNDMGFNTLDSKTAIIPIFIGDEEKAIKLSKMLFDHGIYLSCAIWPAVEKGHARLRATVTANHKKKQIDRFLNALQLSSKKIIRN